MNATKDRILEASLHLFARDGYETTSTSAIAGELGLTKSALYKHFADKQTIFDSLVDKMLESHREAGARAGLASGPAQDAARTYAAASPEKMATLGEALFAHWALDTSAVAFRRMLSLERFRNERAARTYDDLFVNGQIKRHEALFTEMIGIGAFRPGDPTQMALDFWSPIYLLMQAVDCGMDAADATACARNHVLAFAEAHVRSTDD